MISPSGKTAGSGQLGSVIRPFMPELDTLQGIAVLRMLLLHAFYWPYSGLSLGKMARTLVLVTRPGWIGVNLFFVLSGFLITGILLNSKNRPTSTGASICATFYGSSPLITRCWRCF